MLRKWHLVVILCTATACSRGKDATFDSTIDDYVVLTSQLPEFPDPDNKDLLNPDYTSFHKSQEPGFWSSLWNATLRRLGLQNEPAWTAHTFLKTVVQLATLRDRQNLSRQHAIAMRPRVGSHIYVFSDVQGAFHSLVRDLVELRRLGALDNQFKIKAPDTYLFFNGNQIDRSPYNLQTLTLIMKLMLTNPERVIYVAGRHELKDVWRDYGTAREIEQASFSKDEQAQAREALSIFLQTLPVAVYVRDAQEELRLLKIFAHENTVANDRSGVIKALSTATLGTTVPVFLEDQDSEEITHIDATLHAISRSTAFRITDGLDLTEPERGAIGWTSLSSPTLTYIRLFSFANDAFVEIHINESIRNTSISLIKQNAIAKDGFSRDDYHILTGRALSREEMKSPPRIEDFHLIFGSTFDLSGPSNILGQRIMSGLDLRFRKENARLEKEKGLLRLYIEDDRSSPSLALQNVSHLKNTFNVRNLLAPVGASTMLALKPLIEKGDITVFFPISGLSTLRDSTLKQVIHLRTSFANEACVLVRYAKDTVFKRKFGILYQNDDFGKEPLNAAKALLKSRYKATDKSICEASYEADSLDLSEAVAKIKSCSPDAILLFSTLTAAQAFVHEIGMPFLSKTTLLGISYMTDAFRNLSQADKPDSKGRGVRFALTRVVPNPMDDHLTVVRNYRAEMDAEYPGARYNVDSLEAYIAASILIHGMKEIPSPVTLEKVMQRLESFRNHNHQGIILDFNPKTRELSNILWIDTGEGDWIAVPDADKACQ